MSLLEALLDPFRKKVNDRLKTLDHDIGRLNTYVDILKKSNPDVADCLKEDQGLLYGTLTELKEMFEWLNLTICSIVRGSIEISEEQLRKLRESERDKDGFLVSLPDLDIIKNEIQMHSQNSSIVTIISWCIIMVCSINIT